MKKLTTYTGTVIIKKKFEKIGNRKTQLDEHMEGLMDIQEREPFAPSFRNNQFITNTVLLIIHIVLFFLFLYSNIYFMTIVNIGSILFYVCIFYFINENKYILVFRLTYFEILIHLILATIAVGASSGFIMFGTVLPCYLYFTARGILPEKNIQNIENPTIYQLLSTSGMIFAAWWSFRYNAIYEISDEMRLTFQIIIIILITCVFSSVMGYFLKQMQFFEFQLIAQKNKFVKMSRYDALTGLHNRRSTEEYFERALIRRTNFSVIMCDIDDFKHINDTYGHICGDQALIHIAHILKAYVCKKDIVGRWGGEEILIFLPECSLEKANVTAERLRSKVEQEKFTYEGQVIPVTMTFGVTRARTGQTLSEIIKQADDYLYKGKETGKNCVVMK